MNSSNATESARGAGRLHFIDGMRGIALILMVINHTSRDWMDVGMAHPELQGLRRWTLFTRDAQGLYRKFGFGPALHPERLMEVVDRDPYRG